MLSKSKKQEIIKDLEKAVGESKTVALVNFHGLKVSDETVLRQELRKQGVGYKVSRKTLLARVLSGKAEGEIPPLPGEVAIAYWPAEASAEAGSKDGTVVPREIFNFEKAYKARGVMLKILGGIFEGKFVGKEMMMELALIPTREVLLSKLAFLFQSPMQRLALVVSEVAKRKGK